LALDRAFCGLSGSYTENRSFVTTHAAPVTAPLDSVYKFVTDGIEAALDQARQAAGERDVRIMGGAASANSI